jgi:hypothetical protein
MMLRIFIYDDDNNDDDDDNDDDCFVNFSKTSDDDDDDGNDDDSFLPSLIPCRVTCITWSLAKNTLTRWWR